MIVARKKIFNGNDFTIYWDDHVFFSSLSFSLPLCLPLIYGCAKLVAKWENKKKKNLFSRWNQVYSRELCGENILIWQKLVGEGRNNKERVKLFFIQNEQNLENGKNKREGKKERRKRRQSNIAATIFCKNKWRTFKEHRSLTSMLMLNEMATHSSVLAWRLPGTGEPGGLPSMGLHRVRHDWRDLAAAAAAAACGTAV